MAKKRRARRNPSDPNVTYWLVFGTVLAFAGAAYGLKYMSEADRKKVIGI